MEITSLRLIVTQDDLNRLCAIWIAPPPQMRDLHVAVSPRGLSVTLVYQTILPLRFESLWSVAVDDGKIAVRMSDVSFIGVPAKFLRGYILNAIEAKIRFVQRRAEGFILDPETLLANLGVPLKSHLASIKCEPEKLVIECGTT